MRFLSEKAVIQIHDRLITLYGGLHGIRDTSLLDSALNQPKLQFRLVNSNLFELAAAYGYHICQNYPFLDGNKRTARIVMFLFLRVNVFTLTASEDEALTKILSVANGEVTKDELAEWLKKVSVKT
jgi:death-on-curing protein